MPFFALLSSLDLPHGVKALDYQWVDTNLAPNEETVLDIGLVEEILFVGYPSGISDQFHNLPVARRGITATPASVDYEGRPVFLIDASVYPGSSGSPVFIYNTDGWTNGSGHCSPSLLSPFLSGPSDRVQTIAVGGRLPIRGSAAWRRPPWQSSRSGRGS